MNIYDFIKFGGYVRWADDSTDTLRKMKVCLPVKEPVGNDTGIELIPMDEEYPEEVAVSYSVRAAELVPCPDSFYDGYWKALMTAETNGAAADVLLAMLKESGFCLMECVQLMLRTDACKLFPVLCRLFPEAEEMFRIVTWEDREYFARRLTIFRGTTDEEEILVSLTSLGNRLIDNRTGAPVSDDAEAVDGEIYYYFTDEEMLLPEERLVAIAENA